MFHTKKSVSNNLKGKRIGIIGLGPRNGTTHIAISLGNYLCDSCKQKVCIVEQNSHNDFALLGEYLGIKDMAHDRFDYHRVSYYLNNIGGDSVSKLTDNFDCTVFDLGSNFSSALKFLELCDIRIVVGTGAPWREHEFEILSNIFGGADNLSSWVLLLNLGNKNQARYYMDLGIPVYTFPLEPDPISPSDLTNKIFEKCLI